MDHRNRPPRLGTVVVARKLGGLAFGAGFVGFHHWVRRDPLATLVTAEGRRDPYPVYERLRARGPVAASTMGVHSTADYAVCRQVLRSRSFSVAGVNQQPDLLDLSLLERDPPDHTRLRSPVAPAFSPGRLRAQAQRIQRAVDRLADDLSDQLAAGPVDLMGTFAKPLPVVMISALMGVPNAEIDTLTRHGDAIGRALDGVQSIRHLREVITARGELTAMFERLVELRRRDPGDDVLSDLVPALDEGRLSAKELNELAQLLLVAGFETTVNLIGNALAALLERPPLWRRLVDDPSLADQVVDETLRWDPPVQMAGRTALADLELAGRKVRSGTKYVVLLAGANRDPAKFTNPADFDIDRPNAREHLSFSSGIHHCIGRPLALMEARMALIALASRFPELSLAGRPVLGSGMTLRGRRSLPVQI